MSEEIVNGRGLFWKIVGAVALSLLGWLGFQLQTVTTHEFRLQEHGFLLQGHNTRLQRLEEEKESRDELIELLKDEARARRRK